MAKIIGRLRLKNMTILQSFIFLNCISLVVVLAAIVFNEVSFVKEEAVQISVSRTGGVITSAGIILAATFAVLMTQPVAELFVFGFIVALGILMDVFLVRAMLLPSLIMLIEKDDKRGSRDKKGNLLSNRDRV